MSKQETKSITYYPEAVITCSCGATYNVGSTEPKLHVEICAACHPFYTGTQKFIDTGGRLERFKERVAAGQAHKEAKLKKEAVKKSKKTDKTKEIDDPTANS